MPIEARELVEEAITNYVGVEAIDRFAGKRKKEKDDFDKFLKASGTDKRINETLKIIKKDY